MNAKHKTKEIIEKTALNLLNKGSLQGFGVNQLIEECRITKGSLYCHFPEGKNQIIKEVLSNVDKTFIKDLEQFYVNGTILGEILFNIAKTYAETLEKNKFLACSPIVRIAVDATKNEREIQHICQNILNERRNFHVHKLLLCGFTPEEAEQHSHFIFSTLEGGVLLSRAHKSKEPLLNTAQVLLHTFKNKTYHFSTKG